MSLTNTFENAVLDGLLGSGAVISAPFSPTVDISLSLADPGEDGSGLSEPVGNGYARVNVAQNNTEWPVAAAGVKSNGNTITFPTASGGNWGLITHWALFAGGTGIMIASGLLDDGAATPDPKQVDDGDTFEFGTGDLRVTMD